VVQTIWRVCQTFIKSDGLFFEENITIDSEIDTNDSGSFRIRVRWLVLEENAHPYLLVTIEDRNQSTQNLAIADAKKYGLTRRETEIWLLRRANYSYKEIADKLCISINTVKKHLKNIHIKQLV
jgi:DNA-binding CsgD family transcriptional regulator